MTHAARTEEHADLVLLEARREVRNIVVAAVAEAGVRKFAKETGISVGHVSDLSNGRGGLPQARTARSIDEVAGTAIEELVGAARAEAKEIRRAARRREREATSPGNKPGPSPADALTRINLALAEDPDLLALVRLIVMPIPVRRALSNLVSSLRGRG